MRFPVGPQCSEVWLTVKLWDRLLCLLETRIREPVRNQVRTEAGRPGAAGHSSVRAGGREEINQRSWTRALRGEDLGEWGEMEGICNTINNNKYIRKQNRRTQVLYTVF